MTLLIIEGKTVGFCTTKSDEIADVIEVKTSSQIK